MKKIWEDWNEAERVRGGGGREEKDEISFFIDYLP